MSTTDTRHEHPETALARRSGALRPAILGLIGAVVFALGSWNVSLWNDEAFTITMARRSVGELLSTLQQIDAVHGAYYLVIHFWGELFGYSAVALRLPSALAAGAAVAGVYVLAKALADDRVALIAGVVAILLPRITWMGIEGRSYAFSTCLAVWASVVLLVALRRGRWFWMLYAALIAAGIAVSIYVALLVIAQAVAVLFIAGLTWRTRVSWLLAAGFGGLAASPVVVTAAGQQGQLGDLSATLVSMLRQVAVNQWFLGATPTRVDDSNDGGALWARAAVLLAVLCWALMLVAVVAALRRRSPDDRRRLLLLLPWMLVPSLLVIGYSLVVSPLYNPRYFSFTTPAVAVLVALGIDTLGRRWLRIGALVLIAALAAPIYVSQRQVTGKSGTDWSEVAAYLQPRTQPGDGVYFGPLDVPDDAVYSRDTRFVSVTYPQPFTGLVDLTLLTTGADDRSLRGLSRSIADSQAQLASVDRVWVIRPVDYPSSAAAADDAVIAAAGFTRGESWAGPMDAVVEFTRE